MSQFVARPASTIDSMAALFGTGRGAGQTQAHGAGVRVGRGAELQLAAAEHLRGKGGELGVDFQADDRFPILQYLLELLHATRLPFRPRIPGATECGAVFLLERHRDAEHVLVLELGRH